jgi:alkylation response protein AidB-like acyl-CoA dehydrogenase
METAAELRATTRRFLAEQAPMDEVRRIMESPDGVDRTLWKRLTELGMPGLAAPSTGLTFVEVAAVLEETGRALLPAPLLATTIATLALRDSGDEELLAAIAAGTTIATVAFGGEVTGENSLRGTVPHVLDGATADVIIAQTSAGLYLVDARDTTRTPLPTLDATRRLARITFQGTPARRVHDTPHLRDLAVTALAAEQLGGAERCLEMAVAYAKTREQFGQPIGSFQAIQHRCADLLVTLETARSAARHAARLAADGSPDLPTYAAIARTVCTSAYLALAGENIQLHGGIGFTWEHDAHLYLRRARGDASLFGTAAEFRGRLAQLVL